MMTAIVDTPEQAAQLELAPLLVRRPLEAFLDARGLGDGPLEAEPIGEGHSNLTFAIRRRGGAWVLRRPPRPPLPPSAHDVLREARLLGAVQDADVRTPRVLASCDDESVIGAPFYVTKLIEGDVLTTELPPALQGQGARIGEELVDALVEVHAVDWIGCGLEGYGKPTGYLDRVTEWLAGHKPESREATIVHGDYRLGNAMFGPDARLEAIFDWELATIGDPLADAGYMVATWSQAGDPEDALRGLGAVTRRPGFPTRDGLIARMSSAPAAPCPTCAGT